MSVEVSQFSSGIIYLFSKKSKTQQRYNHKLTIKRQKIVIKASILIFHSLHCTSGSGNAVRTQFYAQPKTNKQKQTSFFASIKSNHFAFWFEISRVTSNTTSFVKWAVPTWHKSIAVVMPTLESTFGKPRHYNFDDSSHFNHAGWRTTCWGKNRCPVPYQSLTRLVTSSSPFGH